MSSSRGAEIEFGPLPVIAVVSGVLGIDAGDGDGQPMRHRAANAL
ncbi:hypothetical protein [uncultured Salinibacterium sp.]